MSVRVRALVLAAAGLALLLLGSCASAPSAADSEAFRKHVDAIFKVWGDTNLHPDVDAFVAIWDENMIKMASGKPTIRGTSALRQAKAKAFESLVYETFTVEIQETRLAGDLGWAQGTYVVGTRPKAGGDQVIDEGMFLTVFRKQADGSWKVYRDTMMTGARP